MLNNQFRILIFGAGVIGSAYAIKFIQAGIDVTMLARGKRYETLKKNGILHYEKGEVAATNVTVIEKLEDNDIYDFIFVTLRYDKAEAALLALKNNQSPNVVTMISNSSGFSKWQSILGDRLIPGFPGVGGQMVEGILNARYMPKRLASTNFGEVNGLKTDRIEELTSLFTKANLSYTINNNMRDFLITHSVSDIALLGSLYADQLATDQEKTQNMAAVFKTYLRAIQKAGITINPSTLKIILRMPDFLLHFFFKKWLNSKMVSEMKRPEYAVGAKSEINRLNEDLLEFLNKRGVTL